MIAQIDQHYLYLINRTWTNSSVDWVMAIASSAAVWTPFLILAAGLMVIFGSFRLRAFVCCAVLTLVLVDGVTTNFLKKAVGRPRPNDVRNDVRLLDLAKASPRILALGKPLQIKMSRASEKRVAGNSFPSGHTANNFAAVTLAVIFFRWRGLLWLPMAMLVGYSRIYTGAHYPSDVLVTIFLAVGETILLFLLYDALWRRFGSKFFPEVAARQPSLLT